MLKQYTNLKLQQLKTESLFFIHTRWPSQVSRGRWNSFQLLTRVQRKVWEGLFHALTQGPKQLEQSQFWMLSFVMNRGKELTHQMAHVASTCLSLARASHHMLSQKKGAESVSYLRKCSGSREPKIFSDCHEWSPQVHNGTLGYFISSEDKDHGRLGNKYMMAVLDDLLYISYLKGRDC